MKIRNHRGINKTNGKLKKGYKYSGKKLKSGLREIVKKIKVKKGGKVLGKGASGCVIEPALLCDESKSILKSGKVSKILNVTKKFTLKQIKDEILIGNLIYKKDPNNIFTIGYEKSCKITNKQIKDRSQDLLLSNSQKHDDNPKCNVNKSINAYNVIQSKGYSPTLLKNSSIIDLVKCYIYSLLGIEFLLKNNIYLSDILGNLLLFKRNNKYHPVYTDFSSEYVATNKKQQLKSYKDHMGIEIPDKKNYKKYLEYSMISFLNEAYEDLNYKYFKNKKFTNLLDELNDDEYLVKDLLQLLSKKYNININRDNLLIEF